jgi:hypothetical protein
MQVLFHYKDQNELHRYGHMSISMAVNMHLEVHGLQILNNCPMYTTQGYSNDPITFSSATIFQDLTAEKLW